jgi:hypothetical protein
MRARAALSAETNDGMSGFRSKTVALFAAAWLVVALVSAAAETARAAADAGESREDRPDLIIIKVETLTVPILIDDRIRGQALIELRLIVRDTDAWHTVLAMMPRLRDLYIRRLYRYSSSAYWDGNRLDLDRIKQSFQKVTDKVVGAETASVLIHQARLFESR